MGYSHYRCTITMALLYISLLQSCQSHLNMTEEGFIFGAKQWKTYFGIEVEEAHLPQDIDAILSTKCPFLLDGETNRQKVKDNHLLVLMPTKVDGDPFTLNKLGELIKPFFPKNDQGYRYYSEHVKVTIGDKEPIRAPYWFLMPRTILKDSRNKSYTSQKNLVAWYTQQGYVLPHALEVATVLLVHYVSNGERLLANNPWTYTRCKEVDIDGHTYVVGGFESQGFHIDFDEHFDCYHYGMSCCRRL